MKRSALLGASGLTHPNPQHQLKTDLALSQGNVLRWLFFCEHGHDPGPGYEIELQKAYLTDFWTADPKILDQRTAGWSEREKTGLARRLKEIRAQAEPFIRAKGGTRGTQLP